MDTAVMLQLAKVVGPCLVVAVAACAFILGSRRGSHSDALWIMTIALGLGAYAGNAVVNGKLFPFGSASEWLGLSALIAAGAALLRGESERPRLGWVAVRALALALIAWLTLRALPEWQKASLAQWSLAIALFALLGSLAAIGFEAATERATGRGGWMTGAIGWVMAFSVSQVIVIGCQVQNAAWLAAGVAAVFGVAAAVGFLTRRRLIGPSLVSAAAIMLCGLLLFAAAYGQGEPKNVVVYAMLLLIAAASPLLMSLVLGERDRGWPTLIACAVPALGAVAAAALITPPPFE